MNPPQGPGAPGHSEISILPARHDDLAAILQLERDGFATPGAVERTELAGRTGRRSSHRPDLARAHHPVGVIALKTVGELADLHRLVVAPRYRRQGDRRRCWYEAGSGPSPTEVRTR